jgi:3-oxosteroid 1-dehydrogenase
MDETFDFVVIGSGGGSLSAAVTLRSQGKSVLILEKTDKVGGTTAISGGVMWIPNNRYMKNAGVADSVEQAETYLANVIRDHGGNPDTDRSRRRVYLEQGPKMLDFLVSKGLKFRRVASWPDYYDAPGTSAPGRTVVADLFDINQLGEWKSKLRPTFLPMPMRLDEAMQLPWITRSWRSRGILARVLLRGIGMKLTGKHLVTAGNALQGQMLHAALKAGADIRINSAVKEILVEQDRAAGVVVATESGTRRIGARLGVLINAGGFARNQRLREKYLPGTSTEWSNASPGDTGEMIEEALRLGATVAHMNTRVDALIALPPNHGDKMRPMVQGDVNKPHAIIVDQSGVRYMCESGSYCDIGEAMLERNKTTPAIHSWMIVDGQFLSKYMLMGTLAGKSKPQGWFDSGFVKRGDTIEALATACQINPTTLKATIDRFNGFARAGRDDDFHRGERAYDRWQGDPVHQPSTSLGTLEQGPFLAIPVLPGEVSTYGGVVTDEHARVLKADGAPIHGLYATGVSSAPSLGGHEPGAGGSVGPSLVWGYVAATHAAGSQPK